MFYCTFFTVNARRRPTGQTQTGHGERHSHRRCITALSPTAARQSVPGASAARRKIKPRTQPAGSTAGRHLRQQPAGTDKTIIGSRHDQPVRSDAAEPQNAEGRGLSESRQAGTRERRPNAPTASISAFLGTSVGSYPRDGTHRSQAADTMTTSGTTPEKSPPKTRSRRRNQPQAAEPGSRCSHREPPGKPWRHRRPAARTQPRPR